MIEIRLAICTVLLGWLLRTWPKDHPQTTQAMAAMQRLAKALGAPN